ncbi:MAG TPA: hypothetical protein VM913_02715 [Sphingomicrobium sp.]|jgi:hypothetical protein|nr:hypothetical protein [Sphingomicrobium sp.]
MTSASSRRGLGLLTWLLLILILLLTGAAAATWIFSRYDGAARLVGIVAPAEPQRAALITTDRLTQPLASATVPPASEEARMALLEARLARLENATQQVAGSAGRADALLVAFAARRAIDRGVALGYLEPLLADRFGPTHRQAVATIITASRSPVRLDQLSTEFDRIAPQLSKGGPDEGVWDATRRELASLVAIRRADRPNPRPSATVERARQRLAAGQVDQALAEAMRLRGIGNAGPWIGRARTYVASHRALDEIESAALLAR